MPERVQQVLIWIAALVLIVGTGVALRYAGGYRQIAGITTPTVLPPSVSLRLKDVRAAGRTNNRLAWTLKADQVDSTRDRTKVDFQGNILMRMFTSGRERGTLTSRAATYLSRNQMLSVSGDVVGVVRDPKAPLSESLRLATDTVHWNVGARHAICPNEVTITLKDGVVRGNQLSVDLKTRDHTMRDFEAEFRVDASQEAPDPLGGILKE
jgi:LPS export ABC transporter protein LptC